LPMVLHFYNFTILTPNKKMVWVSFQFEFRMSNRHYQSGKIFLKQQL